MSLAQLIPDILKRYTDNNGLPLSGGKIYSYQAGTVTPLATFTDESGVTPNANPTILDSTGYASIWMGPDAYKFIVKDSAGNTIKTIDNVSYINPGSIDLSKLNLATIAGAGLQENLVTQLLDVQVDNVSMDINGSNQLEVKKGVFTADYFTANSKLEILSRYKRDLSCPGLIENIPQFDWATPTLLAGPSSLPPGAANIAKWSPNGEFLAVGCSASTYLVVYQFNALTGFTRLGDATNQPTGQVYDMAWSPCGDFLAVMHDTTPFISIYQFIGNTFQRLASPTITPGGGIITIFDANIAFSPNSDFLAVCYHTSVGMFQIHAFIMYERGGTTFTDVTGTTTISGIKGPIGWSPDSALFTGMDTSTGVPDVWERKDNIFTAITPPSLGTYANNIDEYAFSPDGNYFVVTVEIAPYILLFQMVSGAFNLLSTPITLAAAPFFCHWSPNSEYLILGLQVSPFFQVYKITGSVGSPTFTLQTAPGVAPVGASGFSWSKTKQYLALPSSSTPFVQIYQTSYTLPSNALLWTRGSPNV